MARLNDPTQPAAESIDALKRRFVRQNREIARANSTQSLRIRNLECEVSRLLSENVSLREQIIKLKYEVEKSANDSIRENVDDVKAKLAEKLIELGVLVKELGQVQKSAETRKPQKRRSLGHNSPRISPDQRNWKNTLSVSEATGGIDGRLPPIIEDKHYPRRTMDAEELIKAFTDPANTTDSPDLGPPPVAHFDEGDPIKFDLKLENSPSNGAYELRDGPRSIPANLETRKKRRESSHHQDMGDKKLNVKESQESAPKDSDAGIAQPLKTGAKRKLNMRDDEEPAGKPDDQDKEMFQFKGKSADLRTGEAVEAKLSTSRTSKPARERVNQTGAASTQVRRVKATEATDTAPSVNRRALGPKNVNTDPVNSPAKSKDTAKHRITDAKDGLAKIVRERNRQQDKIQTNKPTNHAKDQQPVTSNIASWKTVDPPPETPVPPNDLFSPITSEPSADRRESRDTPPPTDLGPDTGTESFGRASRRSRGSINYAQPNLRDKMRRPTSELVDAVGAEERMRQANLARTEREKSSSTMVKQEEDADALPKLKANDFTDNQRQREEATSPLSNRSTWSAADLPVSVITERRRRSAAPSRNVDASDLHKLSGAASAIAALTAGSHRPKKREGEKSEPTPTGEGRSREHGERNSIFDFGGSSPSGDGGNADDTDGVEEPTKPIRSSSRRHSSVPASSEQGHGSLSISRRVERQRENVIKMGLVESSERAIDSQLARTKSVLDLGTAELDMASEGPSSGRGERAASRRRSMML